VDERHVGFVVNPRSAAGRTATRLHELETLARRHFAEVSMHPTTGPGDGSRQASLAAAAGADLVVAVGGDGTVNEVLNGLCARGEPAAALGVLPSGTGSDLVRTLGVPSRWEVALPWLAAAPCQPTDVMAGTFTGQDGHPHERLGLNVIGMGMAGDVVARVNGASKRLGGTISFLRATLASLLAWEAPVVRVRWHDAAGEARRWQGPLTNVFVANGQYCGSGMWVGKGGSMDDGLVEITIIPDQSLGRLVLQTPSLYDGRLREASGVVTDQAASVQAEVVSERQDVLSDVDGEQPGVLPVRIEVRPRAVRLARH